MKLQLPQSRWPWFLAAGLVGLAAGLLMLRLVLTGIVVNGLLYLAGATDIHFTITEVSPWRLVVEDIRFKVRGQEVSAQRIKSERRHWWQASLGAITVEQAQMPLNLAEARAQWLTVTDEAKKPREEPGSLPFEALNVEGKLTLQWATQTEQTLAISMTAHESAPGSWGAQVQVKGPGLSVTGEARYAGPERLFSFKISDASLALRDWPGLVPGFFDVPAGTLELGGNITGRGEVRRIDGKFQGTASVQWTEGEVRYPARSLTATGIAAEFEFTDVMAGVSAPGRLFAREIQVGRLALGNAEATAVLAGPNHVLVRQAVLETLGGKVSFEPFEYFINRNELAAVLLVDGVSIESVMALTQNLPAQAQGRVHGRLPVRLDKSGLRLGTGWLALKPGIYAEIQFNATGLLTGGVSPNQPSFALLQKVESGLLKLKLGTLRLDIRPPDAPAGRSAQLHLEGEPVDPEVKAPVILDLNVNGPIERLLNLGLNSQVRMQASP